MNQPSNIQQLVERSLFEALRKQCVEFGYLPDVSLFQNSPSEYQRFQTALTDIQTQKGFAIEVFGVGSSQAKQLKKVPRIVILPHNVLPGSLGGAPDIFYSIDQGNSERYEARVTPPQTMDYSYAIHLIWNTAEQLRVLTSILGLSVPKRGYVPIYNNVNERFFVHNIGHNQYSETMEGIHDNAYIFEITDLFDTDDRVIRTNIAKINQVDVEINRGVDGDSDLQDTLTVT